MRPIVINGTVLCDKITGIPRYVYEVVTRLDSLLEGTGLDVRIAYRDDGRPIHLPPLHNIRLVPLKAIRYSYNLFVLPRYLRSQNAYFVGLASDMLMTRDSTVVLHDIRPLVMDTDRGFFPVQVLGALPVHQMVRPGGLHGQRGPAPPDLRPAGDSPGQDRRHLQRLGAHERGAAGRERL